MMLCMRVVNQYVIGRRCGGMGVSIVQNYSEVVLIFTFHFSENDVVTRWKCLINDCFFANCLRFALSFALS